MSRGGFVSPELHKVVFFSVPSQSSAGEPKRWKESIYQKPCTGISRHFGSESAALRDMPQLQLSGIDKMHFPKATSHSLINFQILLTY